MKMIQIIGGIVVTLLGAAMAATQTFLWVKELTRPTLEPGELPRYSSEEPTDFIVTMVIGNKTVDLDRWIPLMFVLGILLIGVGAWSCWRGFTTK